MRTAACLKLLSHYSSSSTESQENRTETTTHTIQHIIAKIILAIQIGLFLDYNGSYSFTVMYISLDSQILTFKRFTGVSQSLSFLIFRLSRYEVKFDWPTDLFITPILPIRETQTVQLMKARCRTGFLKLVFTEGQILPTIQKATDHIRTKTFELLLLLLLLFLLLLKESQDKY